MRYNSRKVRTRGAEYGEKGKCAEYFGDSQISSPQSDPGGKESGGIRSCIAQRSDEDVAAEAGKALRVRRGYGGAPLQDDRPVWLYSV